MTEPDIDFLDRRGRLVRLGIAVVFAAALTYFVIGWMTSVTREPNPDPMSQAGRIIVAIAVFVAATKLALMVMAFVRRRLHRDRGRRYDASP